MKPNASLLLQNVELDGAAPQDVLIADGRIAAMGQSLAADGAEVFDAAGGALLPGLNDHHLHLAALAVSRHSLNCSPNQVADAEALAALLQGNRQSGQWLRGTGYHPSVAGEIDVAWLDRQVPDVPVRIQHQGGRLWVFNSEALKRLQVTEDDPLERVAGQLTGRLYEGDTWLRERMQALDEATLPDLASVSRDLAAFGITGITDTSPANDRDTLAWFASAQSEGTLLQTVLLMGNASLDGAAPEADVQIGAHKFHLLESDLPDLENVVTAVRASHEAGRNAAFHCVTRAELAFALAALKQAGVLKGDRIEHASVTPPEWLEEIQALGLIVVTQPALIRERGDRYLQEVDAEDQPWLYRLRGFLEAGVALAGSSDAPYTDPNPWVAMQAATDRETLTGKIMGTTEALTPEQALSLYTSPLNSPGVARQSLQVGDRADLCLLSVPWAEARRALGAVDVRLTLKSGRKIAG